MSLLPMRLAYEAPLQLRGWVRRQTVNYLVFAQEIRHSGLPQRLDEREEALADTL